MVHFLDNDQEKVKQRASGITALIFDVDGVLTPGHIIYDQDGRELKFFNVLDGHRIKMAQRFEFKTFFLTGRKSEVVSKRATELGITECYQGALRKGVVLASLMKTYNLAAESIAFLGDDLIDIPILKRVGLAGAVANCAPEIKSFCHVQTEKQGGSGAAAEFIQFILTCQHKWQEVIDLYTEA